MIVSEDDVPVIVIDDSEDEDLPNDDDQCHADHGEQGRQFSTDEWLAVLDL